MGVISGDYATLASMLAMLNEIGIAAQVKTYHWRGKGHDRIIRAYAAYGVRPVLALHLGEIDTHVVSVVSGESARDRCASPEL